MNIFSSKGTITINGKTYTGNDVSINNGQVIIDGVVQEEIKEHVIHVVVNGGIDSISMGSGSVTANTVGSVKTGSGDVECDDIRGDVKTGSGSVRCKQISGNVKTGSGNVIQK